jgi:hypothetical protein
MNRTLRFSLRKSEEMRPLGRSKGREDDDIKRG